MMFRQTQESMLRQTMHVRMAWIHKRFCNFCRFCTKDNWPTWHAVWWNFLPFVWWKVISDGLTNRLLICHLFSCSLVGSVWPASQISELRPCPWYMIFLAMLHKTLHFTNRRDNRRNRVTAPSRQRLRVWPADERQHCHHRQLRGCLHGPAV